MALSSKRPPQKQSSISAKDHTVKTLPAETLQQPALSKDSAFFKAYSSLKAQVPIEQKVWDKVFLFLENNHKKLNPKEVCLASDNKDNRERIRNLNCLIIVDYTKSKMEKRLHLIDLKANKVHSVYTAHGKGSNTDGNELDLIASKFSNTPGSLQTSLGFYLSAEPYNSYKDTFGPRPHNGVKLDGISCTNTNARKRYVVMHTALYVPDEVTDEKSIGYSEGCVTFTPSQKDLMHQCMHGALVYAHGPEDSSASSKK